MLRRWFGYLVARRGCLSSRTTMSCGCICKNWNRRDTDSQFSMNRPRAHHSYCRSMWTSLAIGAGSEGKPMHLGGFGRSEMGEPRPLPRPPAVPEHAIWLGRRDSHDVCPSLEELLTTKLRESGHVASERSAWGRAQLRQRRICDAREPLGFSTRPARGTERARSRGARPMPSGGACPLKLRRTEAHRAGTA
jgi:hypothetical protein